MATVVNAIGVKLNCPVCEKESSLSCASCKKVYYCCRDHQKLDWKKHRPDCFPAVMAVDPVLGRHLVATKDVEAGDFVLKEKPLVSGPLGKPGCYPVCLACFRTVNSGYSCSTCSWPMCSPKCEKDSRHADYECGIFKGRIRPIREHEVALYEKIIVLRGVMMKKKDPERWAKISDLETHKQLRHKEHTSRILTQTCVAFVRAACALDGVTDDDVDQVLGAVIVNGFVSDDSASSGDLFRSGSFLYYYASMPAHDCRPNSSWVIQSNTEFMIRAAIPIKTGEAILHLYTQPTYGTQERRQYLRDSKYFDCICTRCKDPTELGTLFSGVKCPVCSNGYLLLEDPTDGKSLWKCNFGDCGRKVPQTFVDDVLFKFQEGELMQDPELNNESLKAIKILEKVLSVHEGRTVHHNHYAVHSIQNDLIQRISLLLSDGGKGLTENEKVALAERMAELTRKCLAIADVIWPGINRHQGRLLYFLQQSLIVSLARKVDLKRGRKSSPTELQEMSERFSEIRDIRQKVHKILAIEPEGREEKFIAEMMLKDPDEFAKISRFLKN